MDSYIHFLSISSLEDAHLSRVLVKAPVVRHWKA